MAVVVTMDQTGDTKELLAKYDIINKMMLDAPAPPDGMLAHYCLETPEGIRISNVWETEEKARESLAGPVLRDALAKAGMPPVDPKIYPLHNHFVTSELKARA